MKWLETLRSIRGFPVLCILLCAGLVCMILSPLAGKKEEEAYEELLAHRIAQMAEAMAGVGNANVLVTLAPEQTKNTSSGAVKADTVPREILGIAVVCQGGDDPQVQLSVISMLTAAFGLPASRVYVGAK